MIRIERIAYAVLETPDLPAAVAHYTQVMGLTIVDATNDTAYLTTSVDHHNIVLRKGTSARCVTLGFQVAAGTDLNGYVKQIESQSIKTKRSKDAQPNIADLVSFEDTKGTQIEVFAEYQAVSKPYAKTGIVPNKLGHVAYNVTDIDAAVKFYCDVLGFRVSDWMGDFFAFLRCSPDHHTINLVKAEKNKMHHIAFELRDWGHVKDACDQLYECKTPLIWGPLRHGIGHNISMYHRNADQQIMEHYCELDRVNENLGVFEPRRTHRDYPQRPKVWTDMMEAASVWGVPPPEGFLD
ncbi:MAG TPA: VOC family protein [Candidatus Acidoferrales bacterium]|nr:VOC family protein [Candidatus Acidoferrales bacterium]